MAAPHAPERAAFPRRRLFGVLVVLPGFVEVTESVQQTVVAAPAWDLGEPLRLLLAGSVGALIVTDREWVHSPIPNGGLAGVLYFIFRFASRRN